MENPPRPKGETSLALRETIESFHRLKLNRFKLNRFKASSLRPFTRAPTLNASNAGVFKVNVVNMP
jgi:hypothetical protein